MALMTTAMAIGILMGWVADGSAMAPPCYMFLVRVLRFFCTI